jgi:hypothetical protein
MFGVGNSTFSSETNVSKVRTADIYSSKPNSRHSLRPERTTGVRDGAARCLCGGSHFSGRRLSLEDFRKSVGETPVHDLKARRKLFGSRYPSCSPISSTGKFVSAKSKQALRPMKRLRIARKEVLSFLRARRGVRGSTPSSLAMFFAVADPVAGLSSMRAITASSIVCMDSTPISAFKSLNGNEALGERISGLPAERSVRRISASGR